MNLATDHDIVQPEANTSGWQSCLHQGSAAAPSFSRGLGEAASGKQVSFFSGNPNKTFLDVDSISLQIRGSTATAKYAIYDFVDTANPQNGFKIFLFP